MNKEVMDEYDVTIQKWIDIYEGVDTPEIVALEEKMDDLWKKLSKDEQLIYVTGYKKRLIQDYVDLFDKYNL